MKYLRFRKVFACSDVSRGFLYLWWLLHSYPNFRSLRVFHLEKFSNPPCLFGPHAYSGPKSTFNHGIPLQQEKHIMEITIKILTKNRKRTYPTGLQEYSNVVQSDMLLVNFNQQFSRLPLVYQFFVWPPLNDRYL